MGKGTTAKSEIRARRAGLALLGRNLPGAEGRIGRWGRGSSAPPTGLRGSMGGRQGKWKPLRRYRGAACSEPDRNSLSHQAARLIHHSCRFLGNRFLTRFTATVAAIVRMAARRDKRWTATALRITSALHRTDEGPGGSAGTVVVALGSPGHEADLERGYRVFVARSLPENPDTGLPFRI